jgi:hypothetical protein
VTPLPTYVYIGPGPRNYFPANIGHVEVGDERELRIPPDRWWRRKAPTTTTPETPASTSPAGVSASPHAAAPAPTTNPVEEG